MDKIEKQNLPVFFNDSGEPVAALMYLKSQKVIYTLSRATEEEIINLYEKKDKLIKCQTKQ